MAIYTLMRIVGANSDGKIEYLEDKSRIQEILKHTNENGFVGRTNPERITRIVGVKYETEDTREVLHRYAYLPFSRFQDCGRPDRVSNGQGIRLEFSK